MISAKDEYEWISMHCTMYIQSQSPIYEGISMHCSYSQRAQNLRVKSDRVSF